MQRWRRPASRSAPTAQLAPSSSQDPRKMSPTYTSLGRATASCLKTCRTKTQSCKKTFPRLLSAVHVPRLVSFLLYPAWCPTFCCRHLPLFSRFFPPCSLLLLPFRYKRNGLLRMLRRNMKVKEAPQKWQDNHADGPFDIVITFEERIFDIVNEGPRSILRQNGNCWRRRACVWSILPLGLI